LEGNELLNGQLGSTMIYVLVEHSVLNASIS